jgi:hypothetical protein
MKRTHLMICIVVVLFFPAWAWGGIGIEKTGLSEGLHPDEGKHVLGLTPNRFGSLGLLDPERFQMSQSYSMSFVSNGKQSNSAGMYLNTMTYQFSMPISMRLQVGYMHDPFVLLGGGGDAMGGGQLFIPNFDVVIRPMKYMTIQFHYGMAPAQQQLFPFQRALRPWFRE